MGIEFKKRQQETQILDPKHRYRPKTLVLETRWDPLTGRTVRILDLPIKKLESINVERLLARMQDVQCPFCPDGLGEMTPKFPGNLLPEGRLHFGEVCIIPNRLPFDKFCAVVVLTRRHFVPIVDFTEELLFNGFSTAQVFLRRVLEVDVRVRFLSINWNYFPMSGGSVIHPHLQIIVGEFPSNYQREMIQCGKTYKEKWGRNFWDELIEEEQALGKRYVGSVGNTAWLATYAPRGYADIMAVIRAQQSIIDLSDEDFKDISQGLIRVFRYFHDFNHYSFNMTLYSGECGAEDDSFWVNGRIVTRRSVPPLEASDVNYLEKLHGESIGYKRPERLCEELRGYF